MKIIFTFLAITAVIIVVNLLGDQTFAQRSRVNLATAAPEEDISTDSVFNSEKGRQFKVIIQMNFYFDRFISILIIIVFTLITYFLGPIIGIYYSAFVALCVVMVSFNLIPLILSFFKEKSEEAPSTKDNIFIIFLELVCIAVYGLAVWMKEQ